MRRNSSGEGKMHTRILRLPTLDATPAKQMRPPAVVVTADDSESAGPRIPLSRSLGFVADGPDSKKANGTVLEGRDSAGSSSPDTLGLSPSVPGSGETVLEDSRPSHAQMTRRSCCSEHRRRMSCGLFFTCLVSVSWVGGTHLLRAMHLDYAQAAAANARLNSTPNAHPFPLYDAPFFTTWVCAGLNLFFFPVYLASRLCTPRHTNIRKEMAESASPFCAGGVVGLSMRCGLFTVLWTGANFALVHALRLLDATDAVALFATHVAFVYLLSWVLLQEQFVGLRIVAVILCNTGIALFAYMDGVSSRAITLGGVVLAASAAAATAVYKVLFKKVVGEVSLGQISFFFSLVGLCNVLLLWPLFVALFFTHVETIEWDNIPWLPLLGAAVFIFLANLLGNFGVIWTYEVFLTLGFLFAVPASAAVDVYMYGVQFRGMKLAGVVLSMLGFCMVLLPENWPDYVTAILRWRRSKMPQDAPPRPAYTSRLRTHSGRVK